jgi:hypothetical protein
MPAPSSKPQLPFFDFALPLIVKLPTVLLSELLLPTVLLAAIFYGLRWLGLLSISVYAGEVSFALVLGFCVLAALRFNSLEFVRSLCRERKTNPIFHLPHPIVEDPRNGETATQRAKRFCAIAVIETKAYTICYGVVFLAVYFALLYFLRAYNPSSMKCDGSCEIFRFAVKSIGSGVLFDFFDAFRIELSNVRGESIYFLAAAFLAKLVFAGLVLRIVTLYFGFRKRFRSVLRTSPITLDEERVKEALSKIDPKVLGPRRMYVFLLPWLRRRQKIGSVKSVADLGGSGRDP